MERDPALNKLKIAGASLVAVGGLTKQDWIFIISVAVTVLGMIQDYLDRRSR